MLVDLRPKEEYTACHIKNAVSMPATNIQIDKIFSQLNIFKNKANKLLVFYHDDERHSMQQVQIIFEKGFDNCYLLSGGIWVFAKQYPELLVGDDMNLRMKTASSSRSKKSKSSLKSDAKAGRLRV